MLLFILHELVIVNARLFIHPTFCDLSGLSRRIYFHPLTIVDRKDQTLLYLYIASLKIAMKTNDSEKASQLYDIITSKLGFPVTLN